MANSLENLLANAGPPLITEKPDLANDVRKQAGLAGDSLLEFLTKKNGFYAFESSLHVFPSETIGTEIGLRDWNSDGLWRSEYDDLIGDCVFFAEDIFGGQFCIKDDQIQSFDPETAEFTWVASDLEGWANAIETDFSFLTGFPIAHEWQTKHGRLPAAKRLLPKIPFVAGGKFSIDNLYLGDAVDGMRFRASLALQIRDLPDGADIYIDVVD